VELISDDDALTRHPDQDYSEDEENARAIRRLVNELVDLNHDMVTGRCGTRKRAPTPFPFLDPDQTRA